MNIADIYAIGCLLVWGVSLGIGVAMLCMKRGPKEKQQFPLGWVTGTVIIGLLITMNLAADNPNYLAWVLIALVFLLSGIATWKHRYRMLKAVICFMLIGTLVVFFLWPESDASRYKARTKGFFNQLQALSVQDKNIYPDGLFSPEHPFFTAHPDVKEMWTYLSERSPAWHTGFTGIRERVPIKTPEFKAGTLADNMDPLRKHIRQETAVEQTAYPIWRVLKTITKFGIPIFLVLTLLGILAGMVLCRKAGKRRKELLERPPISDDEFLRQCELDSSAPECRFALLLRAELAKYAKIPTTAISGTDTNSELWYLFDGFDSVEIIMAIEEKTGTPIPDDDEFLLKLQNMAACTQRMVSVRELVAFSLRISGNEGEAVTDFEFLKE